MKKLEKEKVLPVKWLVHDIFYRGGILKENYRGKVKKEFGNEKYLISEKYTSAAERICKVLSLLHFKYVDYAIKQFDNVKVYVIDKNMKTEEDMYTVRLTAEDLMLGLAMVCKNLDLYFDSSKYSLFEMGKLIMHKGFAAALALYERFTEDIYNDVNFTPAKVVHPRDLKENVTISQKTRLYVIKYTSKEGNKKNVSVYPFTDKGIYKVDESKSTNDLFLEKDKQYFSNTIYFDSYVDCYDFLNNFKKLYKFNELDSFSIIGLTLKNDTEEFYRIGTRLGDVLISKVRYDEKVNNYYKDSRYVKVLDEIEHPNHPPRTEKEWELIRQYLSDCQKYYN